MESALCPPAWSPGRWTERGIAPPMLAGCRPRCQPCNRSGCIDAIERRGPGRVAGAEGEAFAVNNRRARTRRMAVDLTRRATRQLSVDRSRCEGRRESEIVSCPPPGLTRAPPARAGSQPRRTSSEAPSSVPGNHCAEAPSGLEGPPAQGSRRACCRPHHREPRSSPGTAAASIDGAG